MSSVCEGSWNELMCTNVLNSSDLSAAAGYLKGLEMSQCAHFYWVLLPNGSWKESVCVATLLVALILAVLSILYRWCTAVFAASQPLPWLHGGCSLGLHGELSFAGLHGDLSSVHGGLPELLGSHGLHGGLYSSALHGNLSSLHGGLPGLLGVTWAVCPPAAWLCIAGVGSLWSCMICTLWVTSPHLWLIFCLKWNLNRLLVPCHNVLF